ncbi:hypothetical protein CHS0354_029825 [Potamilus streckersoni]|uniref:Ig-like domain-containing protein n=1 Tax=Potamilus streckersoni TaxID=2493646 RepID=A0AAE0RLQ0_9BIVA|nr:hypothetical protein CHS0354_029825 [Potamilus streckersoni]
MSNGAFRNPSYVSEGDGGGDEDGCSSSRRCAEQRSSTCSSTSSIAQRFLELKQKSPKRLRYIFIGVGSVFAIIIVLTIILTVHFLDAYSGPHDSVREVSTFTGNKDDIYSTITTTNKVFTTKSNNKEKAVISMSNIDIQFDDEPVNITCEVNHIEDWTTLSILRMFRDIPEPLVMVVRTYSSVPVVHTLVTANISTEFFQSSDGNILLTIKFAKMRCEDIANYSCIVDSKRGSKKSIANITVSLQPPHLDVPHNIVEDKDISLRCSIEIFGSKGSIVWKLKSPNASKFEEFIMQPAHNKHVGNCSSTLRSVMTFTPTKYESGSVFRCEVQGAIQPPYVKQHLHSQAELHVVKNR